MTVEIFLANASLVEQNLNETEIEAPVMTADESSPDYNLC
jgi:hypothetical protein